MRILFVSGTSTGGSARSTEELAARLHGRSHDVATLMGWRPRPRPGQLEGGRGGGLYAALAVQAGRAGRLVRRQFAGAPRSVDRSTYPKWEARFPGRCLPAICEEIRPEVVVATTLDPRTWRSMQAFLAATGTASVLYVRDEGTARHIASWPQPDLVLSNAHSLADLAAVAGVRAVVVPSVVEVGRCRVESTRERVLFVNPVARRGLAVVLAMARARPALPFVIHQTAPLDGRDRARLHTLIGACSNVELRAPVADPRVLYRDARILLAPYEVLNRPRVVLEAQSNAIPVLAADVAGLRECVPPGGQLVPAGAPTDQWVRALDAIWDSSPSYARVAAAARRHSERAEVRPPAIVDRFETAIKTLMERRTQWPAHGVARPQPG